MIFKKDELKLLWPFYLAYFVFGLMGAVAPFMILYFQQVGFSFFKISAFMAINLLVGFLFEVPTGAFADWISRKYSVILGFAIAGISVSLIPIFPNLFALVILGVLMSIGMTFISGANEAWVVDNLHHHKRKDLIHEFFIKSQSIGAFSFIFSPLLGVYIVKNYSITPLWFVAGAGFLLSAFVLLIFGKEKFKPKTPHIFDAFRKTYETSKQGLKFTFTHKIIFLLMLAGLFSSLMGFGSIGEQPFLVSLSMPPYALGYLYSVMAAFMIVVSFASKLLVKMKIKNVLIFTTLLRMLTLLALLFVYPPLYLVAAALFVLEGMIGPLRSPLVSTYFHKFIPKKIRATVVSSQSMLNQFVNIVPALIAGWFLDIFGPQKVIAYSGLFGIFAIITYMKLKE